jgi:hypothetical protein
MTWYPANAEHTTALGVGPHVMNNMAAPANCIGGSEQGCLPANCGYQCGGETVTVPQPMTWYPANAEHTTALGVGPNIMNNMAAPANCVGGSEQGCLPANCGYQCGGENVTVPKPMTWYPANGSEDMTTTHALAAPAAGLDAETKAQDVKPTMANPGHFLLSCHALTMAAVQGVLKGDFKDFSKDATANAESVTPYGGFLLRNHVFAEAQ